MSVNVLCLHGCNQTTDMFKELLKNYIRLGEKQYNLKFHFMEGKYDHPNKGKTWYKQPLDVSQIGKIPYDEDLVMDTLNNVDKMINENDISVLLGFSQGANVVDTFLAYKSNNKIKYAVLMSGYSLVDENRKEEIDIPCLSIISEVDDIVKHDLNPTGYKESYVIKHDKGHKLPTSNTTIRQILTFMQSGKFVN